MRNAFACHGTGFDVVLSADNAIPHLLDDTEILRALRSIKPSLAVLVVSGNGGVDAMTFDSDVVVLKKPFGIVEMDAALRRALVGGAIRCALSEKAAPAIAG